MEETNVRINTKNSNKKYLIGVGDSGIFFADGLACCRSGCAVDLRLEIMIHVVGGGRLLLLLLLLLL